MILLISTFKNSIFFEDLGLNRISAYLKEYKFSVEVKYLLHGTKIDDSLLGLFKQALFIGFSVYDNNIDYVLELSKQLRNQYPNKILFYGSQYISIAYNDILDTINDINFLVLGDGEYPLHFFLKEYGSLDFDQIIEKSPHLVSHNSRKNKFPCYIDINELPWPEHYNEYMSQSIHADLNTSSGCVGACSFCGSLRRKWSGRDPQSIVKEIENIRKQFHIRNFLFADSSFEDPGKSGKKRINKFLDLLQMTKEKYAFSANIRAETFKKSDPEDVLLLKKMKNLGFSQLFIGIESGNDKDLKLYNKRSTVKDNNEIILLLKSCNIMPFWGFIMFNPYSTLESLKTNFLFLQNHKTYNIYHFISYLEIFNGSDIYNKIKNDGLIENDGNSGIGFKIIDKEAKRVYTFIRDYFLDNPIVDNIKIIRDIFHLYYYMLPLIKDLENNHIIIKTQKILCSIGSEYFGDIFQNVLLDKAEKKYNYYKNIIMDCYNELLSVKMAILRKYYKQFVNNIK